MDSNINPFPSGSGITDEMYLEITRNNELQRIADALEKTHKNRKKDCLDKQRVRDVINNLIREQGTVTFDGVSDKKKIATHNDLHYAKLRPLFELLKRLGLEEE